MSHFLIQLPTAFGVKNAWPLSSMGWVAWLTVTDRLLMLTLSLPKTNILCENPECPGFSLRWLFVAGMWNRVSVWPSRRRV